MAKEVVEEARRALGPENGVDHECEKEKEDVEPFHERDKGVEEEEEEEGRFSWSSRGPRGFRFLVWRTRRWWCGVLSSCTGFFFGAGRFRVVFGYCFSFGVEGERGEDRDEEDEEGGGGGDGRRVYFSPSVAPLRTSSPPTRRSATTGFGRGRLCVGESV